MGWAGTTRRGHRASSPGGRGANIGPEPGPPRVCAPPRHWSPPTSSAPLSGSGSLEQCRLRTPRIDCGCRSGSQPHDHPATASRAMDLPRGLLVAWTLSLWPGTCPPYLPILPGAPPFSSWTSAPTVRREMRRASLSTTWGHRSAREPAAVKLCRQDSKRGRRAEEIFSRTVVCL